jgi:hypothetical protein
MSPLRRARRPAAWTIPCRTSLFRVGGSRWSAGRAAPCLRRKRIALSRRRRTAAERPASMVVLGLDGSIGTLIARRSDGTQIELGCRGRRPFQLSSVARGERPERAQPQDATGRSYCARGSRCGRLACRVDVENRPRIRRAPRLPVQICPGSPRLHFCNRSGSPARGRSGHTTTRTSGALRRCWA